MFWPTISGVEVTIPGSAVTTRVASEFWLVLPSSLDAVTATRSDQLYRSIVGVKKLDVAPGMSKHEPVGEVHFFHWYSKLIGNVPSHVPVSANRKSPTSGCVSPNGSVMAGYVQLTGAVAPLEQLPPAPPPPPPPPKNVACQSGSVLFASDAICCGCVPSTLITQSPEDGATPW